MNTLLFVAQVTGDAASGYRAAFPDLPECGVEAPDLAELLVKARQAVGEHLRALADAGDTWPEPTPIQAVAAQPGAFPILVDVAVGDPPVRVNISLGERLVQRLDAAAEARGMTRSGFIAQAVRVSLGEQSRGGAEFDAMGRRLQDELTSLGQKINESIGPESAFSRRMTEWDDRLVDGVRRAADSVSAAMSRRREAAKAAGSDASPAIRLNPLALESLMYRSDAELRAIRDSVSLVGRLSDSIVRFGPFSLGIDGVLSWIPGVGEAYSVLAGGFIVLQGARAGVPLPVLGGAVAILGLRTVSNVVPIAGSLFSDVFTAHRWASRMIVRSIDRKLGAAAYDGEPAAWHRAFA